MSHISVPHPPRELLVGFREDRIVDEVVRLHADPRARARMAQPRFVYGDGNAGARIADDVEKTLGGL